MSVFKKIKAGLEEAIAHERGERIEGVVINKRSLNEPNAKITNFRETLDEQLKNPEFKTEWDALTPVRESLWNKLIAEGMELSYNEGPSHIIATAYAKGYAKGYIGAKEKQAFDMLESGYSHDAIANETDLPEEWVRALSKADTSIIFDVLSIDDLHCSIDEIDLVNQRKRPLLVRDPDGKEVALLSDEQFK